MFQTIRTVALAAILLGLVLFVPPLNTTLYGGIQAIRDQFDGRPERRILFIGNSRTFYNDMPFMVRQIADAAGHGERFHVEMYAKSGVSLETHWADPQVQALLAQSWDDVIIQAQSTGQYSAEHSGRLWEVAADFIAAARSAGAEPAMFVTWRYTDLCPPGEGMPQAAKDLDPAGFADMHDNIQIQHRRLADRTGVDLVNVGALWESLDGQAEIFHLYYDCNHPSIFGSYLSALMFYNYFTGEPVVDVPFGPDVVAPEKAAYIRGLVSTYLASAIGN